MKKPGIRLSTYRTTFLLVVLTLTFRLNGQTTSDVSASQFLYHDFTLSKVKLRNGQIQDQILNYNTISEKMAYKKDDKIYDIFNLELIDTVFIQGSRFVPVGNAFYEVILEAPITFLVQHKGELIPPGTPVGYGGTSQISNTKLMTSVGFTQGNYNLDLPADYTVKVDPIYWVRKDNSMSSFVNQKQFLKIFLLNELELKQFIKQKHIKFDKQSDILSLAEYINSIIP